MKRATAVAVVVGVAAASAGSAWVAASRITSPDEARRSAKPPKASLITVPVERRELSANLVLRGGLSFDEATTIKVPSAGGGEGAATRVITKDPPDVGSEITEGQVIAEISGRPLIALAGALPVFRDLRIGSTGDDVEQLEQALDRLGFGPGAVDGTYDSATESAVDALYSSVGYTQQEPTDDQQERIETARKAVSDAQRALRQAEKAAREAGSPKESERLRLEGAVAAARRSLDSATSGAAKARAAAPTAVAEAQRELDDATAAKAAADAAVAAAEAPGAINPDTGDPYSPAELAALRSAATAARSDVTAKTKAVADARTSTAEAITTADNAVLEAQQGLKEAFAALVESNQDRGDGERDAVTDARDAVAEALERLAEAEEVLTGVPQAEVVFVRTLPRRVGSVSLRRGDVAQGELMSVSGSNLAVRTSVTAADRTLVKPGMTVSINEPDLDLRFEGVVAKVADQPGEEGSGGDQSGGRGQGGDGSGGGGDSADDRFQVEITPGELPTDVDLPTLEGLNFRITIPVKSTEGEVLAVPAAALSATGDDKVQVEVLVKGTETRFVEVTKGLAAQGYVEVAPVDGEELDEGDEVVVGR